MNYPSELSKGYKIFPCIPHGKIPATKRGWKDASDDISQIENWKNINPNFNWAIATGLSELFVIDVDPKGFDWWNELLNNNVKIREAVEMAYQVKTPRGGLHVYFKGEGPSTESEIADGIDTRGGIYRDGKLISGGYVLMPNSKTKDGEYSILHDGLINPIPDCLSEIIPVRKECNVKSTHKSPLMDQPRNIAWAMDLIERYVANGHVAVEGCGGDGLTYRVCASILEKAISPETCLDLLRKHWNPYCQPPWDIWELEAKICNAANYGEHTAGLKGLQSNAEVFANFENTENNSPINDKHVKHKPQWLHVYADNAKDPSWIIPDILPAQGIGMLYGASGSYKSFIALDMSLSLAFGIPGQWKAPPVKNDVLYLAGEGSIGIAKKRWPAWLEWQNLKCREDHRFMIMDQAPAYNNVDIWNGIKSELSRLDVKPSLIVIDTLARLMLGSSENDVRDTSLVTNFMEQLSHHYDCFVLVIHHEGKDRSKGARGSTALYANMDTVLSTRLKADGTELRVHKQKDADVPEIPYYLAKKKYGSSLVLEHSKLISDDAIKPKSSQYHWSSVGEVLRVLGSLGGEAKDNLLVLEIASLHGINKDTVRRQLNLNKDLDCLKPTKSIWAIPKLEYDM